MNRRTFLSWLARSGAALGLGPAAGLTMSGCAGVDLGRYDGLDVTFDGHVTVVGAGAAGLAAGYLLSRYGIDYEILEASPRIGGRTLRDETLADFPIDLGAEWLHDRPETLAELVHDRSVDASIDLIRYSPDDIDVWTGRAMRSRNWFGNYYGEYKFARTTWFGFLERYIAPASADRVRFETPVVRVDSTGPRVVLETADGATRETDRVIVTVPIKVLQDGLITFTPAFEPSRAAALSRVHVPPGIKAFFRCARRFYPDLATDGRLLHSGTFDRLYYDAAFRKDTSDHVLGFFFVADRAAELTALNDAAIASALIDDIGVRFGARAADSIEDVVVKNWVAEPWIRGAYSVEIGGDYDRTVGALRRPIDGRVFFAGEVFGGDNQATVHGAMFSGYDTVADVLTGG